MTFNIEIIKRLTKNINEMIQTCDSDAIPRFADTATHIERAFFNHEIGDKERKKQYRELYESIIDFRTKCPCK